MDKNEVKIKLGVTYFARDPLCPYFDECQKNDIYFLNDSAAV